MVEVIHALKKLEENISMPKAFKDTITDMNMVSFFTRKNIKTVEKFINDSEGGGYANLKAVTLLVTLMKTTVVDFESVFILMDKFMVEYITTLRGNCNIETGLFIDPSVSGITETGSLDPYLVAVFGMILVNNVKG